MTVSARSGRIPEYIGAVLIIVAGGIVAGVSYQFSSHVIRPLPVSAKTWTDNEVETQVHEYVFNGGNSQFKEQLQSIPTRITNTVLQILADNTTSKRFVAVPIEASKAYRTPLYRTCQLIPPGEKALPAISLLIPYLTIHDDKTLESVIYLATSTGHESSIQAVEMGLSSEQFLGNTLLALSYPLVKLPVGKWPIIPQSGNTYLANPEEYSASNRSEFRNRNRGHHNARD